MLTPEQIAEGWIAHDGGKCPVPLDSCPAVMFRDGEIADDGDSAKYWSWGYDTIPTWLAHIRIIAYRPEPSHD